jgi:hypothetical protein
MFAWLGRLLGSKNYRKAQPWETPPEIRKKLRCAIAGLDPDSVKEPEPKKEETKGTTLFEGLPPTG